MATLMSIPRMRLVEIAVQQHGLKFEYFFHSQDGMTPILYAAWKGHYEIICLLVEVKADLNLQQKVWFTSITLWPHSKYCMQSPGSRHPRMFLPKSWILALHNNRVIAQTNLACHARCTCFTPHSSLA